MDKILILDFGSQYTQLIARRVRELGVYCEIRPFHLPLDGIKAFHPKGIILSGSPASVYQPDAPLCRREVIEQDVPVLGICYGMGVSRSLLRRRHDASRVAGIRPGVPHDRRHGRSLLWLGQRAYRLDEPRG